MESYTHKVYLWVYESTIDIVRTPQGDSIRNITGKMQATYMMHPLFESDYGGTIGTGALRCIAGGGSHASDVHNGYNACMAFDFSSDRIVPTSNENRPMNVAIKYYIRAIGG